MIHYTMPTDYRLPFTAALGTKLDNAHPRIKEHFSHSPGVYRYRGTMEQVWRKSGWQGWLAGFALGFTSRRQMLFSQTGTQIPFELENCVTELADGRVMMSWKRTFHFKEGTECFYAEMVFDLARQLIIDYLGDKGQLEVELQAAIENGALKIKSGKQWWHWGGLRLALPVWLRGQARVREWFAAEEFGIQVVIHNPLLGDFFGYTGHFDLYSEF